MKKIFIWSCAALAILAAGAGALWAESHGWARWCDHRFGAFGPAGYVIHKLDLNAAQRSQMKSIWETERPTVAAEVREFASEVRELNALRTAGTPEDQRIQEIVSREGATLGKILLEKERIQAKIYSSVLTAEQKKKADEFQSQWPDKLDRIAERLEK